MSTEEATHDEVITDEPLDGADARAMIAALDAEIEARYPTEENFFELAVEEVAPGRGAFLIARHDGRAVGCGAVRLLGEGAAEIKRMYVAKDARGRGIAGRILGELEARARALGAERLVLETGERQPEAIALYVRAGFARIPRFGAYVDAVASVCFGKVLE